MLRYYARWVAIFTASFILAFSKKNIAWQNFSINYLSIHKIFITETKLKKGIIQLRQRLAALMLY